MPHAPLTLHVDRDAPAARHCARSLNEALGCLIAEEYDVIILHTRDGSADDFGLVAYLEATWPQFLSVITVKSVSRGPDLFWHPTHRQFERERRNVVRRRGPMPSRGVPAAV